MSRRLLVLAAAALAAAVPSWAAAAPPPTFAPGAPGIGDPYFPLDGNGGYDVAHYGLNVAYEPASDRLTGVARIRSRATQDLSSFDFDLQGLTVRAITVDGRAATWRREGSELVVTPRRGIRARRRFTTVVQYDGVPETIRDAPSGGLTGFVHTDDGAVVAGEPHGAAMWYPVNDHPLDKASYTFRITVPDGLEALANAVLRARRSSAGHTTWVWQAREPMASYLTTATNELEPGPVETVTSSTTTPLRWTKSSLMELSATSASRPAHGERSTVQRS